MLDLESELSFEEWVWRKVSGAKFCSDVKAQKFVATYSGLAVATVRARGKGLFSLWAGALVRFEEKFGGKVCNDGNLQCHVYRSI